MNPIQHDDENDVPLSDELHRSLRAMRQDTLPGRDLWPGIAARMAAPATEAPPPRLSGSHRARPRRRLMRYASAASLAAVLVVAWKLLPQPAASNGDPVAALMLLEARTMTHEYQAAWRPLDARRHPDVDASALHQLDRSAAEVRAALRKDPDARFLFDRLQSVYARRLDLSRRLATSPASPIVSAT